MAIKDITRKLKGMPMAENPQNNLHMAWEMSYKDMKLILKRYGSMCHWNRIVLEKGETELYRIEKEAGFDNGQDIGLRTEFFSSTPTRVYHGDQFSFIEYLNLLAKNEAFPRKSELISAGLGNFVNIYESEARKIFC